MSEKRLFALPGYQQLPPPLQSVVRMHLIDGIDGPRAVGLMNLPNPTRTWESDRVQRVVTAYGTADTVQDYVARLEAARLDSPDPVPLSQQPEGHTVDTFQRPETPRFDLNNRPAEGGPEVPGIRPAPSQPKCQWPGCDQTECIGDDKLCHRHRCQRLGVRPPDPPAPARYGPLGRLVAPVVAVNPAPDPDRCPICGLILCACPRPVVLGGTDSGVDPAELFSGALSPLGGPKGPTSVDIWREQESAGEAARERLINQYREQEAAREAQHDRDILYSPRPIGRR